jgi:D-3-phosphoglycerate dehydrogenase
LPATQSTLRERIGEFEVYFASLHLRADADVLARATRLRVIATPSTGLDHLDLEVAAARGIEIVSLKEETAFLDGVTATAELAWALLLAVARRLPAAAGAANAGHWARDTFRGHQMSDKTLGILGYGRLGRIVAEYGKAFRMRVLVCDRQSITPAPGVRPVDFDTLLREADALSIHIHLSEENWGLFDAAAFSRMKPGAFLINTSRGAILDEMALRDALQSGRLGGAGLDVIHGEWRDDLENHPLIRYAAEHDNLVIVPHIGGITHESQRMAFEFTARKLRRLLESRE